MPDPCPLLSAQERPWHPTINDAARQGHLDEVTYFLDNNFYSTKFRCRKKWTPLHEAACHGHTAVVILLILHGAELDAKATPNHMTALHFAVSKGHTPIVDLLLKQSADPNVMTDIGETPLHLAMRLDLKDIMYCLLEQGADITLKNKQNKTPIDMASSQVQALFNKGTHYPIMTFGYNYV